MQGYPGVPPVAQVPRPGHPAGSGPNLTQYPTAPPTGFVPPSIQVVPGPATIAGAPAGPGSPGGVAGVSMAPVAGVALPSAAGGPHGLPPFPSFPLPQGFPNPFEQAPVSLGGGAPQGPAGPGQQTVTGPQGYFPGIGWVGQQGGMPQIGPPGSTPANAFPGGAPPIALGGPPGAFPGGAAPFAGGPPLGAFPHGAAPFAGGPPPGAFPHGAAPFAGGPPPGAFPHGAPPTAYAGGPPPGAFPHGASPSAYAGGPPPGAFPYGGPPPGAFPGGMPPLALTGTPTDASSPQVVAAGLPATEALPASPGPFWLHLGWQLLQTPAVRDALGDLFDQLVRGPNRLETVQAAAGALTNPKLQEAFQQVTTGRLDQTAFTRLFAEQLKEAVTR